jgi:hypothetical protein
LIVDGIARPSEYGASAPIPIEPAKSNIRMVVGPDGLHFSASLLSGRLGSFDSLTIWLNRDGRGGKRPARSDLRVVFRPDGSIAVFEGNGREFVPAQRLGLVAKSAHVNSLRLEDDQVIDSPSWGTEALLGTDLLRPFQPGDRLRIAVRHTSSVTQNQPLTSSWPSSLDPEVPDTWGIVETSRVPIHTDDQRVPIPIEPVEELTNGANIWSAISDQTFPQRAAVLAGSNVWDANLMFSTDSIPPRPFLKPQQTVNDYKQKCPTENNPLYVFSADAKWPHVSDSDKFVRAEGYMASIGLSDTDATELHDSHDFDMKLSFFSEYTWLALSGESTLRLETESKYFDRRALPTLGDHATVYGRWIFDCGHGPRIEIHPLAVFESDHEQYLALWAGSKNQKASVVRIWVNHHPGAVHNYSDLPGPFDFDIKMPPPLMPQSHSLPFVRAAVTPAGGLQKASFSFSGSNTLHITLSDPPDGYYEFVTGFLDPVNAWTTKMSQIGLSKIDINNDHDSVIVGWCPEGKDGEWYLLANINGAWRTIFWNADVNQKDGSYSLTKKKPIVIPDFELNDQVRLSAMGYEDDDCFPDGSGDEITTNTASYWSLPIKDGKAKSKPADWSLYFTVQPGGELASIFDDQQFWDPRLNDEGLLSFGKLDVPLTKSAPSQITEHNSYLLLDTSLRPDGTKILTPDEADYYEFTLADFAKLTISTTNNVKYSTEYTDSWYSTMPPLLQTLFGYRFARIKVSTASPQVTDQPYKLSIKRDYLELPPDPGETADNTGGRIVDLATPDPKAVTKPPVFFSGEKRKLEMPWAWQHVAGDADVYQVLVPKTLARQSGIFFCKYNQPANLQIVAFGMRISVPALGLVKKSGLLIDPLPSSPDGKVKVIIENPELNVRGAYQFSAEWEGAQFYDQNQCAELEAIVQKLRATRWTLPPMEFRPRPLPEGDPILDIREIKLRPVGDYALLTLPAGDTIDMVIASEADTPISARLYSLSGILLGESTALPAGTPANVRGTSGLVVHSRLTVSHLTDSSRRYLLQLSPATETPVDAKRNVIVGIGSFSAAR